MERGTGSAGAKGRVVIRKGVGTDIGSGNIMIR